MAPIVAPGVCRYAVNQTYGGRAVVNVLDFQIDTTGSLADRADSCFNMAGIIINEWADHVMANFSNDMTFESVSWVDLDSLNGSTGERTSTDQETLPLLGGLDAQGFPGNVAVRINKETVASRGARQGRMYVCGGNEAWTSQPLNNVLVPATLTFLNGEFESMLGNMNQTDPGTLDYESRMVVVHTIDDVFQDFSEVTALTVDPLLATQRRRLRG